VIFEIINVSVAHVIVENNLLCFLFITQLAHCSRFNIKLGVATLYFAQSIVKVIRFVERSPWIHHVL